MFANIKSEFRKLFTVRSTYLILFVVLALEVLIFWFASAYHLQKGTEAQILSDPQRLATRALVAVNGLSILYAGLIPLLNVTHEYRYNTIMYSLSASKSRSSVLFSKLIVISIFAVLCGAVVAILAPLLAKWGLSAHHYNIVRQHYNVPGLVWRVLFSSWAFAMLASIIAFIVRNQVGTIATVLLFPTTVEGLLSLWLHNNSVYLPFSSISNVILNTAPTSNLSYAHAAFVALAWIVGGGIIAWVLFLRRDAN